MMRRGEVDLERGDKVESLKKPPQTSTRETDTTIPKSPRSPKSPKSPKGPSKAKTSTEVRTSRSPVRRDSHSHADSYSYRGSSREKSPVSMDRPDAIDEKQIIINCNCEEAQNRTFLPFLLPSDIGLTRPSKDYWIIEPLKEKPETEYIVINADYILRDRAVGESDDDDDDDDDDKHETYIARPLSEEELEKVDVGPRTSDFSGAERWKFMNYGTPMPTIFSAPKMDSTFLPNSLVAKMCQRHLLDAPFIINAALIQDLTEAIYPSLPKSAFEVNDAFMDWLEPYAKMQVYGLLYFSAGFRQYFQGYYFPQSYIVADYIAFIENIRNPPKNQSCSVWLHQLRDYQRKRIDFWKVLLDPFKSIRSPRGFERNYKNACLRWQSYPLHVARIQRISDLRLKRATANPTSQKFASSIGVDSTAVHRELSLNEIICLVVGISSSDRLEKLPKGSLDALKAHNFHKAPFRLDLTDDLTRHLTFRESNIGDRPTLLLLNPRGLVSIFNIQYAGLFTVAGLQTLFLECVKTYVLFFDRDNASRKIARNMGIDLVVLHEFSKSYTVSAGSSLDYADFPIYAKRLRNILDRMNDWRPQTYKELAIRPYNDPLTYHAFWFSGYLAIFTILSLATSIAQTYAQFKSNATQAAPSPT